MKILCTSLFKNTWISYWTKFLESRGHEVSWLIGHNKKLSDEYVGKADGYDAILCMWGSLWARTFLNADVKAPVFVICRSFEMFRDTACGGIDTVPLHKAARVFMLNESHYQLLHAIHPSVIPIFIKNGIDIDEWTPSPIKLSSSIVAWICNLNFKKGVMLAAHSVSELRKVDKEMTLEHIGQITSHRMSLYLENIMPYLKTQFYTSGHKNSHQFVKDFLQDKRYILSCSMVEGHPMNILEAMAMGCQPLIHRYPGIEDQFPVEYIWNDFDELRCMYKEEYRPLEYRQFIVDNYDYRETYKPVIGAIECIV